MTAITQITNGASASATRSQINKLITRVVDVTMAPFNADPTGGSDSTAAIQAAVDWTSGANRGTIFFPLGSYQVTAPITYNYDGDLSIHFLGAIGANIFGSFSGYVFDRHLPTATVTITIASPGVVTDTAHGKSANDPIRFETTGALPTGLIAGTTYYVKTVLSVDTYTVSATAGGTVIATTGSQSGTHTRAPINTSGGRVFEKLNIQNGHAAGGCIRMGSTLGGTVRDCILSGFIDFTTEDAVGVSSKNIHIESCTFGNNGTLSGSHYIIIGGGGAIQGCSLSGAGTAVRAYGSGLHIAGNRSERCNTSFLLGLDSGDNNVGLSGFSLMTTSTEGSWTAFDLAGLCDGFVISGVGALGHDSGNSGVVSGIQGSQYGLRIRAGCARNGVIQSCTIGGDFQAVAAFAIGDASSRANLVIRENSALAPNGGGVAWLLPSNAYTARFYNNNVAAVWTYAQRPTGSDVLEGDEFDISDSNTATWGATVAGSGSNHIRMRYNGTNWTVVGK